VTIRSLDGLATNLTGPTPSPTFTVTAGARIIKVWLANDRTGKGSTPPRFKASAKLLLESGIIVETSWETTVLYNVSETEMRLGKATIEVPATPRPVNLEITIVPTTADPEPASP
jgi:hypothetical protein